MTTNDAINKIRVLLSGESAVTEKVAMAKATLVDGTNVEVEGDFEVGKALSVITEEGAIPAPQGIHQTTENVLVTVDEAGVITQIEEISEETQKDEKKEEMQKMEEGDPHFTKDGKLYEGPTHKMNGKLMTGATHTDESELLYHEEELEGKEEMEEEMIIKIVEAMKPYFEEIKEVKAEIEEMKGKFQKFSKEPAGKPIKKAEAFEASRINAVERIAKLRNLK